MNMQSEFSPLLSSGEETSTSAYSSSSLNNGGDMLRRSSLRGRVQPVSTQYMRKSNVIPDAPEKTNQQCPSLLQICISLPYNLLCIASPHCAPCCCLCCCRCIRQTEYGILERFGKFDRRLPPGMHVIKWPMERVVGRVSVRMKQLDVDCICKSLDHVFISVNVSIQFQANVHQIFESFYSLASPSRMMVSHALDLLRSTLPRMSLDDIFASHESIAVDLLRTLNGHMNQYGCSIHHVLLTRIHPNDHVRHSMNEMEANRRIKESMPHKAEAIKLERVKAGEANAERLFLLGVGVARQRREIARGMVETAKQVLNGGDNDGTAISAKSTMDLLLLTQYLDMLTVVGVGKKRQVMDSSSCDQKEQDDCPRTSLLFPRLPQLQREDIAEVSISSTVKVENLIEMV